jgi:hypothetical protein
MDHDEPADGSEESRSREVGSVEGEAGGVKKISLKVTAQDQEDDVPASAFAP